MLYFDAKLKDGTPVTIGYEWDSGDWSVGLWPGPEILSVKDEQGKEPELSNAEEEYIIGLAYTNWQERELEYPETD